MYGDISEVLRVDEQKFATWNVLFLWTGSCKWAYFVVLEQLEE